MHEMFQDIINAKLWEAWRLQTIVNIRLWEAYKLQTEVNMINTLGRMLHCRLHTTEDVILSEVWRLQTIIHIISWTRQNSKHNTLDALELSNFSRYITLEDMKGQKICVEYSALEAFRSPNYSECNMLINMGAPDYGQNNILNGVEGQNHSTNITLEASERPNHSKYITLGSH